MQYRCSDTDFTSQTRLSAEPSPDGDDGESLVPVSGETAATVGEIALPGMGEEPLLLPPANGWRRAASEPTGPPFPPERERE